MMLDRYIRPMKAKDTVHDEAQGPGFCSDCKIRVPDVSSQRGLPRHTDTRIHGIDSPNKLTLSDRPRPAGRVEVRRRRLDHARARNWRQTSLGRESVATAKSRRGTIARPGMGFGCPDPSGQDFYIRSAKMSNSHKPTRRPRNGRSRPENVPSGFGETGPYTEMQSGSSDASFWEELNMSYRLFIEMLMDCERRVIDAMSDDPNLTDELVRFKSLLPRHLVRLIELQGEKLAIAQRLVDSSARVWQLCKAVPSLSTTPYAIQVADEIHQKFGFLVEHHRKSLIVLEKALNSVANRDYPMNTD